jgi:hypothetical protein
MEAYMRHERILGEHVWYLVSTAVNIGGHNLHVVVGQLPHGGNDEKNAVFVQNRPRVPIRLTAPFTAKKGDTDSLRNAV